MYIDGLELIALKAAPRLVESMAAAVLWRQLLLLPWSRYSNRDAPQKFYECALVPKLCT